jgi:hypothetical protein
MINVEQISGSHVETEPYSWAAVGNLFSPADAAELAASYPLDHFKTVAGYGGEKDYEYEARALIAMGSIEISHPEQLSDAWLALARDFVSPAYRSAISSLTGLDLMTVPLEVNVFHYGPRACLGPHCDLEDKIATHVLYFNESWDEEEGGCLSILRSGNADDVAARILPIVGNSAVLVRSDRSWHEVPRVVDACRSSRRSLTATFYRPGSISTMWPPGDATALHDYDIARQRLDLSRANPASRWRSLLGRLRK